jgi:hypothetical protein
MFKRIKYVSRFAQPLSHQQIVELAEAAGRRNAANGITGALMTSGGLFFQIIEGPPEAVDTLYAAILRDERHQDVLPLSIDDLEPQRLYPDWGMRLIDLDDGSDARLEPLRAMLNAILTQRVLTQELTGALERAVSRELLTRG